MPDPYTSLLNSISNRLTDARNKITHKRQTAHVVEVEQLVRDCESLMTHPVADESTCHEFVQQLDEKVYARQFSAKTLALLKRLDIGD